MKAAALLTLAASLVAVVVVAPPAQAAGREKTTVKRLRAEVRGLRAEVAALKIRAAQTTPTVTTAAAQVREEVEWAQGSLSEPLNGQLVAEAALDYVVGHVSVGLYGYLELVYGSAPGGPDLPPYRAPVNAILAGGAGICVHAERTFARIVESLGFQVRDVGFDYRDPGNLPDAHSTAEVYYGGSWHFFDPTFGQFWVDPLGNVLSIGAVRSGFGVRVKDEASFTNLIENPYYPGGDDAWFETLSSTGVVIVPPSSRD